MILSSPSRARGYEPCLVGVDLEKERGGKGAALPNEGDDATASKSLKVLSRKMATNRKKSREFVRSGSKGKETTSAE